MSSITIIDYGTSNLGSMRNMLKKIGVPSTFATTAEDVLKAEKIILPGVGAFDAGMRTLNQSGMVDALHQRVKVDGVPILGVCLGMQLMTRRSEEGKEPGLGWLDAEAIRFDPARIRHARAAHGLERGLGREAVEATARSSSQEPLLFRQLLSRRLCEFRRPAARDGICRLPVHLGGGARQYPRCAVPSRKEPQLRHVASEKLC